MRIPPAARTLTLATLVLVAPPLWASRDCDVPPEAWQPRSAVIDLAQRNGWQVERLKVDDGCYEIVGRDADGRRLKAKIDPGTLKVVGMKREHGDGGRERSRERERRQAPPASAAPPANGPPAGSSAAPSSPGG